MCMLAYLSLLVAVFPTILFVHGIGEREFQESLNSRFCPQYDELHYYLKNSQKVWSGCIKENDCLIHIEKTKKLVMATLKNAADNDGLDRTDDKIQRGCMDLYRDFVSLYVFGNTASRVEKVVQATEEYHIETIEAADPFTISSISQLDNFHPIVDFAYLTLESSFEIPKEYDALVQRSSSNYAQLKRLAKDCRQELEQATGETKRLKSKKPTISGSNSRKGALSSLNSLDIAANDCNRKETLQKSSRSNKEKTSTKRLSIVRKKKEKLAKKSAALEEQLNNEFETALGISGKCREGVISNVSGTFRKLQSQFFKTEYNFLSRALDLAISPTTRDRLVAYFLIDRYFVYKQANEDKSRFHHTFLNFVHEVSLRYSGRDLIPFGFDHFLPLLTKHAPSTYSSYTINTVSVYSSLLTDLLGNKWIFTISKPWTKSFHQFISTIGTFFANITDDSSRNKLLKLFDTLMYKVTAQLWSPSGSSALQKIAYEKIADKTVAQNLPVGFPVFSFYSPAAFLAADQTFRLFLCSTAISMLFKANNFSKNATKHRMILASLKRLVSLDVMNELDAEARMELLAWIIHDLTKTIDYPMNGNIKTGKAIGTQEIISFRQEIIAMAISLEKQQWLGILREWISLLAWIRKGLETSANYYASGTNANLEKVKRELAISKQEMDKLITEMKTKQHVLMFPEWIQVFEQMKVSVERITRYCAFSNLRDIKLVLKGEINVLTQHILGIAIKPNELAWLSTTLKERKEFLGSTVEILKVGAKDYLENGGSNVEVVEDQDMAALEQAMVEMTVSSNQHQPSSI